MEFFSVKVQTLLNVNVVNFDRAEVLVPVLLQQFSNLSRRPLENLPHMVHFDVKNLKEIGTDALWTTLTYTSEILYLDINLVPRNSFQNLQLGSLNIKNEVVHRRVPEGKEDRVQRKTLDSDGFPLERRVEGGSLLIHLRLVGSSVFLLLLFLLRFACWFDVFLGVDNATYKFIMSIMK